MSRPTMPGPPDPDGLDHDVESLLGAALAGRAAADAVARPVDPRRLAEAATVRARRIRRRRTVAVSALGVLLVAALPFGLLRGGLLPGGIAGGTSVVAQSTAPSESPAPASSVPTGVGVGVRHLQYRDGTVVVPDAALLQAGDLRAVALVQVLDSPPAVKLSTTGESICPAEPLGLEYSVGGRKVGYAERAGGSRQWTVTTTVRVLRVDGAARQLDWLRRNLGSCPGSEQFTQVGETGVVADDSVLAYQVGADSPKAVLVVGAVRQGRTTAGVRLQVPASAAGNDARRLTLALDQGRRLLVLAQQRLVASGLVAAADADLG